MSKSNTILSISQNLQNVIQQIPNRCNIHLDAWHDFTLPADWGFKDRVNPNFHLAFVREGNGSYILEEEVYEMHEGQIIFVSSGFRHSRTLDLKKLPRIFLIRFSILDNTLSTPIDLPFGPFAFSYVPKNKALFLRLFNLLAEYCSSKRIDSDIKEKTCNISITQILLEILSSLNNSTNSNRYDERIGNAIRYMKKNIDKSITLNELAIASGLTVNYFRNIFKKQYGLNPKEYLIQLKVLHAYKLIYETDWKIKDIAQKLGYSDPYAFSKQFKFITGKWPTEIRKSC